MFKPRRNNRNERGSALLVVLVFAAIIAIMLYRELPIAAFEAQRQREEIMVSRGEEYKRGVKLFVRKLGRFPSSIDELENTNRIRFLRRRYVDPFTGKDDWRLIHAGPGGVILDSKVPSNNTTGKSNALGQGATFGGFNNSFTGDLAAAADNAADNTPTAGLRQRPPASKNAATTSQDDPLAAVAAGASPESAITNNADNLNNPSGAPNSQGAGGGAPSANIPTGGPQNNGVTSLADQLNITNPQTPQLGAQQNQNQGLGNTSAFGTSNTGSASTPGSPVANGGQLSAGGIAGVASIAAGKGIKLVNEQSKYKLWEFYYDLRKDQQNGAAAMGGQAQPGNTQGTVNGTTNGAGGASNSSSGFSIGSFGASSSSPTYTPPPAAQPSQPPQQ